MCLFFFFSSRSRHTSCSRDWSSDVCSSDLERRKVGGRFDPQSGHAIFAWRKRQSGAGPGCLGARLLSEIPKLKRRLHQGLVERRELGQSRGTFCSGKVTAFETVSKRKGPRLSRGPFCFPQDSNGWRLSHQLPFGQGNDGGSAPRRRVILYGRSIGTSVSRGYGLGIGNYSHCVPRRFANQLHAAAHLEFCQQGRNVKFHGPFRKVEMRSNFLVRETLRNTGKNFLFSAG